MLVAHKQVEAPPKQLVAIAPPIPPCCNWETVALSIATLIAILTLAGHFTRTFAPPVVYTLGSVSGVTGGAAIISLVIKAFPHREYLTWEELEFIANDKVALGFRWVSDLQKAEREKREGFYGDSNNLDPFRGKDTRAFIRIQDKYSIRSEAEKARVLRIWEDSVEAMIRSYVTKEAAYLLVDYKNSLLAGYDHREDMPLGKMGKAQIAADKVVAVLPPLPPSSDPTKEKCVIHFRNALILAIREYAQKCRSDV